MSQGRCVAAISSVCVYVCLSGTTTPPPLPNTPASPPLTQMAGRQVEGQISRLVSEKRKYITASGYLRQSAGINVGRFRLSRGDGSRDEGATARVLTAERPIEAY